MRTVTAVAHRGDPFRFRENTLPSLRSALDRGADAVEIDVRLTRDGVPVLLHDATLERLWLHDRPVAALSATQVARLTEGGVPTLAEALEAVAQWEGARDSRPVLAGRPSTSRPARFFGARRPRGGREREAAAVREPEARVMVDLPEASPDSVRRIMGVVRDCGASERAYYTGGARAMLAVRAADPAAEIALTWTSAAPPRPALLAAVAPRWLNYRWGLVSKGLATRVHADGLLLSAWTADSHWSMSRLLRAGVDSITTNRVGALHGLLAGRGAASRSAPAGRLPPT